MRRFFLAVSLAAGFAHFTGCTSSGHPDNSSCPQPENPYSEGTGHYNGYEWAKNYGQGQCVNSSTSFVEGCQRFVSQATIYNQCQSSKKK